MVTVFNNNLPQSIKQLAPFKADQLNILLSILQNDSEVLSVLLGGSVAYRDDLVKSDVDLFCLINNVGEFEKRLDSLLSLLPEVDVVIFQGYFAWTQKLYSIYFKSDVDFAIDLCLIGFDSVNTFFWEPDGFILFDKIDIVASSRSKQMANPDFTKQPFLKSNPFSLAIVTLKKIEKNISRGHLWNAVEQVNVFRRYIMQIIRLKVLRDMGFLGRVDRDIEDVLPSEINLKLSTTIPIYESADIALKTLILIEVFFGLLDYLQNSNEKQLHDWILKQLGNERNKLTHHIHNA